MPAAGQLQPRLQLHSPSMYCDKRSHNAVCRVVGEVNAVLEAIRSGVCSAEYRAGVACTLVGVSLSVGAIGDEKEGLSAGTSSYLGCAIVGL